ncbi:MAG: DMT family transporter [Anaerolineae bacterium]|nr:DMT family transporter [Anaerolineae bacterium]
MNLLGVIFGLASAASWGAGDFSGGLASRRTNVYSVVMLSQSAGLVLLAGLALLLSEPVPSLADMLWAAGAGLAGGLALAALYRGLAIGRMGVVAPMSAVVSAAVPVLFGLFFEGLPGASQILGFGLALGAVWFVSRPDGTAAAGTPELALALLAGLGFGLFLIVIDRLSSTAVLWPLVTARAASITLIALTVLFLRQPALPAWRQLPLIVVVGIFDAGGNAFYALAARAGRLDAAAVLSSLYPAATVLLARFILDERLAPRQWAGIAAALLAVVLIAA